MKKLFFISILFVLATLLASAQKLYVVSIGIADYKDPQINDLRWTENDVESFNNVIKKHTKEVYTLLGREATHANAISTIQSVFAKASNEDAVILYFSGHGYPGGFCCYDMSQRGGGLTYPEIASLFKGCKAKKKWFLPMPASAEVLERKRNNLTPLILYAMEK